MSTFNGKNENLKFTCGQCGENTTIEINLDEKNDKEKLWNWLQTHSAEGGKYQNIPKKNLKKEIKDHIHQWQLATKVDFLTFNSGKNAIFFCECGAFKLQKMQLVKT